MTTYSLHASRFTSGAQLQAAVGQQYHLGLSDGTFYYGYTLVPDTSVSGGFHQRSDTAAKDALTSYSSPNLIDRDFVYWPRITDGDFSGGGYQQVWTDTRKYFDSDLDPRVPGFLQLRSQWARVSIGLGLVTVNPQVVAWNSDYWYTVGEANGNIYSVNGAVTGSAGAGAVLGLDTDGTYLYAGTAANLWRSTNGTAWTQVTAAINGTATMWWVFNQGTNGYFAYYQSGDNLLYKVDLTGAFPIAAASQPQVAVGANAIKIVDVCEYQTSIAILTTDSVGPGFDLWYFDGTNLTRILRVDGYLARGMCQALGGLYVGAQAYVQTTSPILAKVDSGTFEVVARPGSPFPATGQGCLQPRSSSQYVYWPIVQPTITAASPGATTLVVQYDVLTGAVSHLPIFDTHDLVVSLNDSRLRRIAVLGDHVAECWVDVSGTATLQYQKTAFFTLAYQSTGWLVSSLIDFTTPGIAKRFRRVEVHHSPLAVGEQILVEAFVDRDPLSFTTSLTPVPSGATASNGVLDSTVTQLTFGADTVGKVMYYAIKLTSGTSNASTPRVNYVSVEIGGTWVWTLTLSCTSKRRLLDGETDETQPSGKDLAYLISLAYENGTNLTLYHRNGQSYTVTIESCELMTPSPKTQTRPQEIDDEEYDLKVVLRQVA